MRLVCALLSSGTGAFRVRRCRGSIIGAFFPLAPAALYFCAMLQSAFAANAGIDSADTAWILTATALVLMMTLPGLALFYGGLGLANGVSATSQFGVQLLSVAITIGWTVLASYVILRVISRVIGLRVDQQDEIEGLDPRKHGERGLHSN